MLKNVIVALLLLLSGTRGYAQNWSCSTAGCQPGISAVTIATAPMAQSKCKITITRTQRVVIDGCDFTRSLKDPVFQQTGDEVILTFTQEQPVTTSGTMSLQNLERQRGQ